MKARFETWRANAGFHLEIAAMRLDRGDPWHTVETRLCEANIAMVECADHREERTQAVIALILFGRENPISREDVGAIAMVIGAPLRVQR